MSNLLWSPSKGFKDSSNITAYAHWLRNTYSVNATDYHSLWKWSVDNIGTFWESLIKYFDVRFDGSYFTVTNHRPMPHSQWFEGIQLSYAEHIFRKRNDRNSAIIYRNESGARKEISWNALAKSVAAVRDQLIDLGVETGDRVVAFMPASIDTTIAFLATNSIGAIWSGCSPDFGTPAVVERFAQIKPKVLFAVDQYQYSGKTFDTSSTVKELVSALPTLTAVIYASDHNTRFDGVETLRWQNVINRPSGELHFTRVPFNHPIWVLYSSGTTGAPKAIVHSTGGILLEQLKYGAFHNDFKPGERCTWYTTTGWMMWNYIHGCLLAGCTLVLYDGNPGYPDLLALWKIVAEEKINHFGTSASFILACLKKSLEPKSSLDLESLRSIGSTGSTLPPEGFSWIYEQVKKDLWLAPMSGGTDVCSAFVGGNPTLPVHAGEIQCRALGCRLEAFDEQGVSVNNEMGEMVITEPMPSMPIFFWNDPDKQRYKESYFEMYPGIWRHGDWIAITAHDGIIIYGRSDATLNRGGIRIGTSEIYRVVETIPEIKDSLIVCIEKAGGTFWMPLFVVMKDGYSLTGEISSRINSLLKQQYSPRHVPDEVIETPDIPYTISGKKSELPVKKILMGIPTAKAVNRDVLRNPESIDFFTSLVSETDQ